MMLPSVRGRFVFERERDLEERMLSFDPVDLCPITLVFATRGKIAKGRALAGFVVARMALRVGLRGTD
jgi:hypothetical protein